MNAEQIAQRLALLKAEINNMKAKPKPPDDIMNEYLNSVNDTSNTNSVQSATAEIQVEQSTADKLAAMKAKLAAVKNKQAQAVQAAQAAQTAQQSQLVPTESNDNIAEKLAAMKAKLVIAKTKQYQQQQHNTTSINSSSQVEVRQNPHIAVTEDVKINMVKYGQYQQPTLEANAHIIGQVTRIVDTAYGAKDKFFYIYSSRTNREYHCKASFFLPIEIGDTIDGPVHATNVGNSISVEFLHHHKPFVQMSFNKDAVIQVWIKILRGTGFGAARANKLYDFLDKITNYTNSVISHLSEIALAYNQTSDRKYLVQITASGLSEKQSIKLLTNWYKKRDLRRLHLLGMTNTDIKNIQLPPDQIYEQCLKNPYVLYQLKREKADIISKQLNLNLNNNDVRCGQIVRYIHSKMQDNSWTCVPLRLMYHTFPDFVNLQNKLENEFKIMIDADAAYLLYPHQVETDMANNLINMIGRDKNHIMSDPHYKRDTLTDEQKEGIKGALMNPITIITGGAGTGKTTMIDEIIHNLDLHEVPYLVTSFTGKAVARVKEVVATIAKTSAATIHLTLAKGFNQPLPPYYIIVDETSMITINLLYRLCKMFKFEFHLIMVGDINQLQPIGWGAVFQQCVNSGKIPVYRLKINHRSMLENNIKNGIISNANRLIKSINTTVDIGSGEYVEPFNFKEAKNFCLHDGNIDSVYSIIRGLTQQGINSTQITVISPYKKFLLELNSTCQSIFNDGNNFVESGGVTWMIGDRVMMRKNNYEIYIMNGEEGIVTEVSSQSIKVRFNNGAEHYFLLVADDVYYNPYDTKNDDDDDVDDPNNKQNGFNAAGRKLDIRYLCHCFALSTHRSQGSEWDFIILYIPGDSNNSNNGSSFLDYRLIYTSFTRAKKAVWCVGNMIVLNQCANNRGRQRYDNLARRIHEGYTKTLNCPYIPSTEGASIENVPKQLTSTEHNAIGAFEGHSE